jgi:hypothetical protein
MPLIPEPIGAPEQMKFLRWVRDNIAAIMQETERRNAADRNVNLTQNSTMNMLVEQLGEVQGSIDTMIGLATFDAAQVVSGEFTPNLIPDIDAGKLTTGTVTRPVNATGDVTATGNVTAGGDVTAGGHGTFNAAWNYDVSAVTRRAVWMDAAGRMGQTTSSRRFKKDIEAWSPEEQAILALRTVRFHWRPEHGDDRHWEYGVVAEELDELGLGWLVSYEDDGVTPHSVHYERLAVALLPLLQRLAVDIEATNARLNDVEQRLDRLENR